MSSPDAFSTILKIPLYETNFNNLSSKDKNALLVSENYYEIQQGHKDHTETMKENGQAINAII